MPCNGQVNPLDRPLQFGNAAQIAEIKRHELENVVAPILTRSKILMILEWAEAKASVVDLSPQERNLVEMFREALKR
jgi:hypothetical protein